MPERRRPRLEGRSALAAAGRRLRRLTPGEAIATLAAILLFVLMFFDWYGYEVPGIAEGLAFPAGEGIGGNAWQTLDLISIVLALTVALVIGICALTVSGAGWKGGVPPSAAIAVMGIAATLLIAFRIVDPPDLSRFGNVEVRAVRETGLFLGFAAAAAIAYGGYRAMGERGTSFAKVAEGLSNQRPRRSRKSAPKRAPRPAPPASKKQSRSSSD